ncbi:hypothetical protein [Chryseobacterium sp. T20]|uniref:hypothetical protein n=1 Tax=Chryseobacterium sp. T20 TaxID=3395375 RepID=UPI0039BCA2B3
MKVTTKKAHDAYGSYGVTIRMVKLNVVIVHSVGIQTYFSEVYNKRIQAVLRLLRSDKA